MQPWSYVRFALYWSTVGLLVGKLHMITKRIVCVEIILLQLQICACTWSPYWGETFSLIGKLIYCSTSYMTTGDLNYTRFEILHVNHMKVQYFCMTMTAHVCTKFKNFKIFLFISLHFTAFLWIPLHFSTFLFTFYIFRHASVSSTYPSTSVCPSQGNLHSVSVCETSQSFETTLRWLTWWPTWPACT